MLKLKNIYDYKPDEGTVFTEPSQTRQSDYEDINVTVSRIIRGEVLPRMPDEFEYDDSVSTEDILSVEHPLDGENMDLVDYGSPYEDDIRQGIENALKGKQNIQQERELSGAPTQSSSETNVPVDNLQNANSETVKD